jgi:hypothetical protein
MVALLHSSRLSPFDTVAAGDAEPLGRPNAESTLRCPTGEQASSRSGSKQARKGHLVARIQALGSSHTWVGSDLAQRQSFTRRWGLARAPVRMSPDIGKHPQRSINLLALRCKPAICGFDAAPESLSAGRVVGCGPSEVGQTRPVHCVYRQLAPAPLDSASSGLPGRLALPATLRQVRRAFARSRMSPRVVDPRAVPATIYKEDTSCVAPATCRAVCASLSCGRFARRSSIQLRSTIASAR